MLQARGRGVRVQSSRDVTCSGKCADGARVGQAWMRWATALFLGVVSSIVSATGPSAVSGSITEDTRWVLSESPYLLTGDVTISNGAVLTIESGVRILMGADASLIVSEGGLSASGMETQPILITSEREEAGIASPGDWGSLRFDDGTRDAVSTLSYVRIRYGSGVVLRSASPTFDDVSIDHHAAPAITLDLNSSPTGHGLHAEGNALNGILVPAGAITTDTAWRLKGIPYVVAEGVVEVGLPPFGFNPSNLTLVAGRSGQLILDLPILAPGGGKEVALSSSAPSVVQVASTVTVPAGKHSVEIPVTALAHGSATLTADGGIDLGTAQAAVTVTPLPPLALTPSTLVLGKAHVSSMEVGIPALAAGDVRVMLSTVPTGIAQVPEEVVITSGARSASFEVRGDNAATTILRAEADGYATASAAITVRLPVIDAPAHAFVAPELSTDLILALSDPAPPGGIVVGIHNSAPSILGVPSSVTVPTGETQTVVPLAGLLDSAMPVTLTFSATGHQAATTEVTVRRIVASLGTGVRERNIPQGITVTLPVSLSTAAPPGGVTLNLAAAIDGVVNIAPTQVFVPEGQTTATNLVSIHGVAEGLTAVTLQATAATPGIDNIYSIRVTLPVSLHFYIDRLNLGKSLYQEIYVACRNDYGYRCDFDAPVAIRLSSSDPTKVSTPAEVIMGAHEYHTSFNVIGLDFTSDLVSITAETQAVGIGSSESPLKVSVIPPSVNFSLGNYYGPQMAGGRSSFSLCLRVEQSDAGHVSQRSATNIPLSLQVLDASPEGVVEGIYASSTSSVPLTQIELTAGQDCIPLYANISNEAGSYRIHVSAAGLGQWTSEIQEVVRRRLTFEDESLTIGKGLEIGQINVHPVICVDVPEISLASNDPKVEITSIYHGSCGSSFSLRGTDLTNVDVPASITATASGFDPAILSVSVVPKKLIFNNLDGRRSLASEKDDFYIGWDGKYNPYSETNGIVNIYIKDGNPENVIQTPSIVDWYGSDTSNIRVAHWESAYIASPLHRGRYRVAAELDGDQIGLSEIQTVGYGIVEMELNHYNDQDSEGAAVVGQGLVQWIKLRFRKDASSYWPGPPTEDVTVHLVSRAPDWVQVPESVTFVAGESAELLIPVIGVAPTPMPVLIEAYVEDDAEPSSSMDVRVYEPTLVFDMPRGRVIEGFQDLLTLSWEVHYPCPPVQPTRNGNSNSETCSVEQTPATSQTFQLAIVDADPEGIVEGFWDFNSEGDRVFVAAVDFFAEQRRSNEVYVGEANTAGNYRVQASLGPGRTWVSEPVTVGAPELRWIIEYSSDNEVGIVDATVGLGLRFLVKLEANVAGWPVDVVDDVDVQLSCANLVVCEADDDVTIEVYKSSALVGIVGRGVGTTTLVAHAAGLQAPAPLEVSVVEPEFYSYFISSLGRDTTYESRIGLWVSGSDQPDQIAATDLTVTLASLIPTVASIEPATITIPAGDKYSGPALLRGLRTGTTAVTARGAHMRPYVSQPITVTGN